MLAYLAIEGPIGVGKTRLAERLAGLRGEGCSVIFEDGALIVISVDDAGLDLLSALAAREQRFAQDKASQAAELQRAQAEQAQQEAPFQLSSNHQNAKFHLLHK